MSCWQTDPLWIFGACVGPLLVNEGASAKGEGIWDLKDPVSLGDREIAIREIILVVVGRAGKVGAKGFNMFCLPEVRHRIVRLVNAIAKMSRWAY